MAEKGVKVLEEREGDGSTVAEKHDTCDFDLEISLARGDVVLPRERWNHRIGRRMIIAGVEKALLGMRVGGYRKVRVSPHLAYGAKGVHGKIPPNAVLTCELWLHDVTKPSPVEPAS